ncbi:MAG: multicopper oxidase domain-containing protein [Saprospiraceae bacterium]|nr:multicopper oxidase domain-containing protein [Saprospiraceae bacterium]
MKKITGFLLVAFLAARINAQTQIPIPPLVEGTNFNLIPQTGLAEIYPGVQTHTMGYNGAILGPTLLLEKGETVAINVHNQLGDTTTTHWHGLHVSPSNDGSPHTPIMEGDTWAPVFEVMDNAATYWYHPHLHGKTLSQVVKGMAGFIIVRDAVESALVLPRTYGVDDVPLVFQWKTFNASKQIVETDEQDNEVLVNGVLRGSALNLPAQVVRLRLLNGSSHRYFDFGFANSLAFKQIAGDGGLLDAPVSMTKLILGPGERAEILVDLTGKEGQTLTFRQFGSQLPQGYPGGMMMMMGGNNMMGPLDDTDFDLMSIHVTAPTANAVTAIPSTLVANTPYSQAGAIPRSFGMTAQPMMSMTNFFINGLKFDMETINFEAELGKTEVWTLTNSTMMAHPFHVHGLSFYVISVNGAAPPLNLKGRKDVVTVPPMQGQVKIVVRFEDFADPEMPYMYHCHILSHEDTGMMGQFLVTSSSSSTTELEPSSTCPICIDDLPLPKGIELSKVVRIEVFNLGGRLMRALEAELVNGASIDVSDLPTGGYMMKMSDATGKTVAVQRFFKN